MSVSFFLRRTNTNVSNRHEYLFLTAEKFDVGYDTKPIAPTLPGNQAINLASPDGAIANNFMFNIGNSKLTIAVSGVLQQIPSSELPSLSVITYDGTTTVTNSAVFMPNASASASTFSGKRYRHALINFIADQMTGRGFGEFKLGYPDWVEGGIIGVAPDPEASMPANTPANRSEFRIGTQVYRLFEGMVTAPKVTEEAGVPDQYPFNFQFVVGNVT